MLKKCKICGSGLPEGRRKYCSEDCYREAATIQNRERKGTGEYYTITECQNCGDDISGESSKEVRKYCKTCQLLEGQSLYNKQEKKKAKQYKDYLAESKKRQSQRPPHWININDQ